jgi:hypothetical protein
MDSPESELDHVFISQCIKIFTQDPQRCPVELKSPKGTAMSALIWHPIARYKLVFTCPLHAEDLIFTGRWTNGKTMTDTPRMLYSLGKKHG